MTCGHHAVASRPSSGLILTVIVAGCVGPSCVGRRRRFRRSTGGLFGAAESITAAVGGALAMGLAIAAGWRGAGVADGGVPFVLIGAVAGGGLLAPPAGGVPVLSVSGVLELSGGGALGLPPLGAVGWPLCVVSGEGGLGFRMYSGAISVGSEPSAKVTLLECGALSGASCPVLSSTFTVIVWSALCVAVGGA